VRRGFPTLMAILLVTVTLGAWAWWLGRPVAPDALAGVPATLTARTVPADWGPMRVMAANVRMDEPSDGENGWLKRRELLRNTILKYQPEMVACQEVTPVQGAYLNKELAAWYAYFPRAGVGRGAGGEGGGTRSAASELLGMLGTMIESMNTVYYRPDRFELLDGESGLVLPNERQASATENTFFTLAVLREKHGGVREKADRPGTVIVVDAHLRHGEAFAIRCANTIREKIAGWEAKYPRSGVLVLGDMNRDRTTALYAAIAGKAGAPDVLTDLFDYSKRPAGEVWGTYHGFTGKTTQPWPTDLIFFGGTFRAARHTEIVRDGVGGRYPTDHFLVMGEVE
jgi:endonuclease/exonuclease/phosphatase family metal-dependent hydrolase